MQLVKFSIFGVILLSQVCLAQPDLTITDTISASADDSYQRGNGISDHGCTNVFIRSYTDTTSNRYICGGFRFDNLTIPQGATISEASFKGYVKNYVDINCKIYGNAVDSAHNFIVPPHVIDRDRTDMYVSWVATLNTYTWHRKRELEGVIQEIVNRPGWKSGNSIVLLFIANSDKDKFCAIEAWDDYTSNHAKLIITYVSTGIEEESASLTPIAFVLFQNHPNPFSQSTEIRYSCPVSPEGIPIPSGRGVSEGNKNTDTEYDHGHVSLKIYDLAGRLVRTLVDRAQKPGYYEVTWDGKDALGDDAASAVYFCRLITAADCTSTKKMVLLR